MANETLRGAVIGYGGAFNMGKGHLEWMRDAGIVPTAACDLDKARMESARADFPGIATYTEIDELLKNPDVDLVTIITPHDSHAGIAIKVARSGKGVVVEKPMCISVKEATEMIDAAKKNGVALSIFHNRRYDGDFLAIKETIGKGLIGDVFQIQAGGGHYGHPGTWWRANKAISGGILYDWGAHFIDWILNLMPGRKVISVTGFLHKRIWHDQTNEDHGQVVMRFDDGSSAELTQSNIMSVPMPRWRILGTKGGLLDDGSVRDGIKLFTQVGGIPVTGEVRNKPTVWNQYYKDVASSLKSGGPLPVTAESARRIIAIIEAAEESSKSGKSQPVAFED